MFDLNLIERDWENSGCRLSDKEILEIYKSEHITCLDLERLKNERKAGLKKISFGFPLTEEEKKEHEEHHEELIKIFEMRIYLNEEPRKKVVAGCMDTVFKMTRYCYNFFNEKVPLENLYYVCLKGLMKSAKYCIHYSTKACFRSYVNKSIRREIIDYMARREHISYRNAYYIIEKMLYGGKDLFGYYKPGYKLYFDYESFEDKVEFVPYDEVGDFVCNEDSDDECTQYDEVGDFVCNEDSDDECTQYDEVGDFVCNEDSDDECTQLEKLTIQGRLTSEVDYDGILVSDMFMRDYDEFLQEHLTDAEEIVMRLSYGNDGRKRYTVEEIALQFKTTPEIVKNIKERAISKIRENKKLNMYQWYDTIKK